MVVHCPLDMKNQRKTQKLYCYVDETGQDTTGQLFIVAVVMTDDRRDELATQLETAEQSSGKRYTKWRKTSRSVGMAYFDSLIRGGVEGKVYAEKFVGSPGAYYGLEVLAASKAINLYRLENEMDDDYKVTIAIDGLPKNMRPKIGRDFRLLGVKIRNVHGERDESSPIIRFADAVAGVVRDAHAGRPEFVALQKKLHASHILFEL